MCKLIDGKFYARDRTVYLSKKPYGVRGYLIYSSLDPVILIDKHFDIYRFMNGEVLEAYTNELERFFYKCVERSDGSYKFERLYFEEYTEDEEGEDVLLKHLGLQGLRMENSLDLKLERWLKEYKYQ